MKYRIFAIKENAAVGFLDYDNQKHLTTIKLDDKFIQKYEQPITLLIDNFIKTSYPSAHSADNLSISGTKDDFIKYLSQELQNRLQITLMA